MNREQVAKNAQDYDPSPPRCLDCLYFRRQPFTPGMTITTTSRSGKPKTVKVSKRATHINPVVDRCTFGNFLVNAKGVCNEWRTRDGQSIDVQS